MSFQIPTGRTAAALALAFGLTVSACDGNEPDDTAGDQEFITQVVLRFQNPANVEDVVIVTATDGDGDGDELTFATTGGALRAGVTYRGTIELNDTINSVSITQEIQGEAEEHLFRYAFDPAAAGTVVLTDRESGYGAQTGTDLPVGLTFDLAVAPGATGTGTVNATLFHFEDAGKTSATSTSDERDIDIDFPVSFAAPTAL